MPAPVRVARLPVVGVMGSGVDAHAALALPLGRALASLGVHLLTGGGGGVMAAVARGFTGVAGRTGLSLGILRGGEDPRTPPPGYPNPWVELVVQTHLPESGARGHDRMSRNHLNVLSSDVVVALPGGAGTASEVELALRYGRGVVAYRNGAQGREGLPDALPVRHELDAVLAFVCDALSVR